MNIIYKYKQVKKREEKTLTKNTTYSVRCVLLQGNRGEERVLGNDTSREGMGEEENTNTTTKI